jgi:hypothetical protein
LFLLGIVLDLLFADVCSIIAACGVDLCGTQDVQRCLGKTTILAVDVGAHNWQSFPEFPFPNIEKTTPSNPRSASADRDRRADFESMRGVGGGGGVGVGVGDGGSGGAQETDDET